MTDQLIVQLDSVKMHRNQSEWTTVPRARATYNGEQYETSGVGWIITGLLKQVYGKNPQINPIVHVERGEVPVFVPMALNRWLSIDENGNKIDRRPEQFKNRG